MTYSSEIAAAASFAVDLNAASYGLEGWHREALPSSCQGSPVHLAQTQPYDYRRTDEAYRPQVLRDERRDCEACPAPWNGQRLPDAPCRRDAP